MNTLSPSWAVAIFTARESISTLNACIQAAILACEGKSFTIDVLVNGNRALAEEAGQLVLNMPEAAPRDAVRVWFIPFGDKAHTWNEYIHKIWPKSATTFFIDGYAEVNADALALLSGALENEPNALAATGVPTFGRSAKTLRGAMINGGGIHGNLYALSTAAMVEFQEIAFCLPLGLYRTDSFIGAVLMYRFAPMKFKWDTNRVLVHPQATWFVKQEPVWSKQKLMGQLKRRLRQAQGDLENRAAREHLSIHRRAPETMARTITAFVNEWIAAQPSQAKRLFLTRPLTYFAARKIKQEKNWSEAEAPASLIAASNGATSVREDIRLAG
jgi:hypothetical protein